MEKSRHQNPEIYVHGMNMFDEEYSDYHNVPVNQMSPYNNIRIQNQSKSATENKGRRYKKGKQSKMSM